MPQSPLSKIATSVSEPLQDPDTEKATAQEWTLTPEQNGLNSWARALIQVTWEISGETWSIPHGETILNSGSTAVIGPLSGGACKSFSWRL